MVGGEWLVIIMETEGDSPTNADAENDTEKMRRAFELFMLTGGKKNQHDKEETDETYTLAVNNTMQQPSSKMKKIKNKNRHSSVGQTPPKSSSSSSSSDRKGSLSSSEATAAAAIVSSANTTANELSSSETNAIHSNSSNSNSSKKRFYQLVRTFNDKVQHIWLDIDGQILPILHNICSIRSRLPLEWKVLQNYDMNMVSLSINDNEDESWKNYGSRKRRLGQGYNCHASHALQIQDIQLAFINDITQHEKMVLAVRKLMSELADCHNALGRCLDTIWKFHCSTMVVVGQQEMIMMEQAQQPEQQHMLAVENVNRWEEEGDDDDDDGRDNSITNIVQLVTDVYHMLSTEIYRKQALVLELIESSGGDETLLLGVVETRGRNKSSTNNEILLSSQQIAQKICTVWSSKSANESYVDMSIITRLFDIAARRR